TSADDKQIPTLRAQPLRQILRHHRSMTLDRITLEAHQRHASGQCLCKVLEQGFLCSEVLPVLREEALHITVPAQLVPDALRRPKRPLVSVSDACRAECLRQGRSGEADRKSVV